ncbi:MAG: WYL domain-containing transcriptional regulator [Desulfobacterales bacterium]|nr:WYL domain-containing transcriptional regulator [Desulfobacterales bacterium]
MGKRKPTYGSGVRLAEIIFMLTKSWKPLTLNQICEYFSISKRTAQRYKKALNENLASSDGGEFLKIIKDNGIEKWYLADQGEITTATFFRVISVYIAMVLLKSMKGTILENEIKNLWNMVTGELKPSSKMNLELFDKKFRHTGFGRKNYFDNNSVIINILKGIIYQNKLQILHYSKSDLKDKYHIIHPYTLLFHRDSLYLHCHVEGYSEIRTFMIDRIKEVILTKETFRYPINYNPDKITDGSFGILEFKNKKAYKIRVCFRDNLWEYITTHLWHQSQKFTPIDNDNGTFIMEVELSNTNEFLPWLLQFGSDVKVLEPESLKNEIKELLFKAYKNYN